MLFGSATRSTISSIHMCFHNPFRNQYFPGSFAKCFRALTRPGFQLSPHNVRITLLLNICTGVYGAARKCLRQQSGTASATRFFWRLRTDSVRVSKASTLSAKRWLTSLRFIRCLRLSQSAAWRGVHQLVHIR